jgi:hypothetical protein
MTFKKLRFYRKEKVLSELNGKLCLDESIYIEKRISKNGLTYYVHIEDFTIIPSCNKIFTTRLRKDYAEHIIGKIYFEKE